MRKKRSCKVLGCKKPHYQHNFCKNHFENWRRCGKPEGIKHKCIVSGCNNIINISHEKYCRPHRDRKASGLTLDLRISCRHLQGARGRKNPQWRGGVAEYPNHYQMKKQRLIVLERDNWTCVYCGKWSKSIHHLDETKWNHAESNLVCACPNCNSKQSSPYFKKYGYTEEEIVKMYGKSLSYWTMHKREMRRLLRKNR